MLFETKSVSACLDGLPYTVSVAHEGWLNCQVPRTAPDEWCLENIGKKFEITRTGHSETVEPKQSSLDNKFAVTCTRIWSVYAMDTEDEGLWAWSQLLFWPACCHFKHKHHAAAFRMVWG